MKTTGLITGIVLVLTSIFMMNDTRSELKGKIQDYSGVGILFSTLEVYKLGAESQLIYKAITNINGEFELPELVPGNYKVVIKAEGFEDRVEFVSLSGKDKNMGAIELKGNVVLLSPAIIYGKKA